VKARGRGRAGRSAAEAAKASRATVRLPAAWIDCPACGDEIRAALKPVPGVQAVAVNAAAREVAVTFDASRLDAAAIRARLDTVALRHR
jgi:copper chaperone CopZ